MSTLGKLPYAVTDPKSDPGMPGMGDAVVVCRADGTASFFSLGTDHKALLRKLSEGGELSAGELGRLEAATRAMTLWFASQNEKIMEALTAAMNAPGSVGDAEFPSLN